MKKIFMIGDSTMKFNDFTSYPQFGWGQVLNHYTQLDIPVFDFAENGRSTKSFIDEKRFDLVLNMMEPGDYLICQFGHNDEKQYDETRYTTPFDTYQKNLKYFADEFTSRGGHIVFATSITRHKFVDGVCVNTHGDYPKAMLEFANKNNYTCIDLNKITLDLYNSLGEEESKKLHMIFPKNTYQNYMDGSDDHSHLMFLGAYTISRLFVEAVAKTNDPINECFKDLNQASNIDWAMLKD